MSTVNTKSQPATDSKPLTPEQLRVEAMLDAIAKKSLEDAGDRPLRVSDEFKRMAREARLEYQRGETEEWP